MHFKIQALLAATAITAAAAAEDKVEPRQVKVIHVFEHLHVVPLSNSNANAVINYTPNKRDIRAIFARADLTECQEMATDIIKGAPTAGSNLNNWAESQLYATTTTDPCSLYAPSSLSEELMAYMTEVVEWLVDIENDAEEFMKECSQYGADTALDTCASAGTVFFTANNQTETVQLEPIIASATAAAGDDDNSKGNAGPRSEVALTGAIAAAAGALGFIMSL